MARSCASTRLQSSQRRRPGRSSIPGDHGVGTDPDGFAGAVFDGRYIYFVPLDSVGGGAGYNGEVIRYDTQSDFLQASSWSAYDSAVHGTVDAATRLL